jgi:demethylmenaquinone methyltransferase/2-methoxy-6-polyprenyl-1,4-benzoquinol methylase
VQDPVYVRDAFARVARRYVVTNHVLSCGTDILWRRRVGRIVSDWEPARVLDVATGTGDVALEIERRCPDVEVVGADFCEEMLDYAGRRGLEKRVVSDALAMPFENGLFDVVTVAFGLRNMADYGKAVDEMRRVLRPGGHLLILDFSLPAGILRGPYRFYLHRVLPRLAGLLTGERDAYEYLGGSIEDFPSGEKMLEFLGGHGFEETAQQRLSFGVATIYTGRKAG